MTHPTHWPDKDSSSLLGMQGTLYLEYPAPKAAIASAKLGSKTQFSTSRPFEEVDLIHRLLAQGIGSTMTEGSLSAGQQASAAPDKTIR